MTRASPLGLALAAAMLCPPSAFAGAPNDGKSRNDLTSIARRPVAESPQAPESAPPSAAAPLPVALSAPPRQLGRGNPLWGIPLESLRATRERPLFSVSRRPPPPPVAYVEPAVSESPPPPPPPPEKPPMTLVGVVHGGQDDIGLFLDRTGPSVIRLRVGQQDRGWVVRSLDLRAVILEKESQQVKLELPARDGAGTTPGSELAMVPPVPIHIDHR
jgi:general secretion pathway protein N